MRSEFCKEGTPEWDLMWSHLKRVFPETDLRDTSDSGESWEYMGTYYSAMANYDNTGLPVNLSYIGPCWNHQFRHRDYQGKGRQYVNIVADFESIPGAVEKARELNAAMACALNNGDGEDRDDDDLPF